MADVKGPNFSHYKLEIRDPNTNAIIRTEEPIYGLEYRYEHSKNKADNGGTPVRDFKVVVYKVDDKGNLSDPQDITVENPQVPAPAGIFFADANGSVQVKPERPEHRDIAGLKVWGSLTPGFTPSPINLRYDGPDSAPFVVLPVSGTWYFRAAFYDNFNAEDANVSAEVSTDFIAVGSSPSARPPQQPFDVQLTPGLEVVLVRWKNPTPIVFEP